MNLYAAWLRPLLFRLDAEQAHRLALEAAARFGRHVVARQLGDDHDRRLQVKIAGLHFPNPVGLAAGFDKSGTAVEVLAGLGFGSLEIGSVSLDPSQGNPKPRLWRLPEDRAIVVHYGLPNDGAAAITQRLSRIRLAIPLGINIVKTNRGKYAPPDSADQIIAEYAAAARAYAPHADYLTFNLSCPNTEDGRDFFADAAHLRDWLAAIADLRLDKPVFMKVSPLGGIAAIERLLQEVEPHRFISGFMFNLAPVKPEGLKTPEHVWRDMPGAVSGPPSSALADACIAETFRRMDRSRFQIIGAGGISTAQEAYGKIRRGASAVQLLTALIYEGPGIVRTILRGLPVLLERDGLRHINDAVGIDVL